MTAAQLMTRMQETRALTELWSSLLGSTPEPTQFWRWLDAFGFQATQAAIERTFKKSLSLNGSMNAEYMLRYTTSVAKQRRNAASVENKFPIMADSSYIDKGRAL